MRARSELVARSLEEGVNGALRTVRRRAKRYAEDPDEENVHDLRTSVRRLTVAFQLLPKRLRRAGPLRGYVRACRDLFRLNTEIRDCDILVEKLPTYSSSRRSLSRVTRTIERERSSRVSRAQKAAGRVLGLDVPALRGGSIDGERLAERLAKVVAKRLGVIERDLPRVVADPEEVDLLHELRKECKKLRYVLEMLPEGRCSSVVVVLREWQDVLGSIRDLDMMITYLRESGSRDAVAMVERMREDRSREYGAFVELSERAPDLFKDARLASVVRPARSRGSNRSGG